MVIAATIVFLVVERVFPGRKLPRVRGWYLRAALLNGAQLGITLATVDVHRFNDSDIPLWDRLFGTYRDATEFAPRCGFPEGAEEKMGAMLLFQDVYESKGP